jgi:hypothetical protein
MVVGWRNVELSTLDWRLVLDLDHGQCRSFLEERTQQVVGLSMAMLDQHQGHGEAVR